MVFKKVAVTLDFIKNDGTWTDPGHDLEIYGDLWISVFKVENRKRIFLQTEHMWHRNSTDRIVLNENDALFVNNRKEIIVNENETLFFFLKKCLNMILGQMPMMNCLAKGFQF